MKKWRHNNDVIINKISMYVQNLIPHKTYILDFSYFKN